MSDNDIVDDSSAQDIRTAMAHILLYCSYAIAAMFAPRWDWYWIEGWIFVFLFTAFLISAFIPLAGNPYLLKARVSSPFRKQQAPIDKAIFCILSVLHLLWVLGIGLEVPILGGGHGFEILWVALGGLMFILAIVAIYLIVSSNPFLVPAVGVQANQRIIDDGIYSWVRHPMYAAVIAMSFGGSLLTSSILGLVVSVMILGVFWWRLLLEERFLLREFSEYKNYTQKVKYRLFPLII
jgi:protein-S-isoprenylcysteine O-methyltransferase Ste14